MTLKKPIKNEPGQRIKPALDDDVRDVLLQVAEFGVSIPASPGGQEQRSQLGLSSLADPRTVAAAILARYDDA